MTSNRLLENAKRVIKGAARPAFSKEEYEDEMLRIAQAEARGSESQAMSFSRMITNHDPRVMALYKAARRAARAEAEPARAEMAKARSAKDLIFALLERVVRNEKRADETDASAFNRLVRADRQLRSSYEIYRALP